MKIKPTLIIAICLLITACSCDSDDENIKSVVLTETNYFYESDAYLYALNVEKQGLIDYNNNPNNPDYDQGVAENNQIRIGEINGIIESITTGIIINFPPLPPPPPICFCWDIWSEFKYLVIDDDILAFEATVTIDNQEIIYQTNSIGQRFNINGYDVDAKAFSFQIEQDGYNGPALLNITKVLNEEDDPISYSIPIFIE
ncbi:hypothetical protein [Olleya sp. R77988]|uniref:hypothetical protein n=1 Tax=Olleya sp. R77988 TaxID=3093875 RepID=UPI0037C8E20D